MTAQRTSNIGTLWEGFGRPRPPENITQQAFDHDDKHLRKLLRLHPGDRAEVGDLWKYTQDLLHTEIQNSLFVYVLPFCFEAWREDLRGTRDGYGGFVEYFYPLLANRHVFDTHLTSQQSAAVSEFMRQTILEEMDDQRGLNFQSAHARPYRWIRALTSFGVLLPDIDRLWTEWWVLKSTGRAVAALQYISCLMYSESENPVFAPWTREAGGGPPSLWEFEGHLYSHSWLKPNINFLQGILNVRELENVLRRAVESLEGQPEHIIAAGIQGDLPLCIEILESRCVELPRLLATTQQGVTLLSWST